MLSQNFAIMFDNESQKDEGDPLMNKSESDLVMYDLRVSDSESSEDQAPY